ncbi:MAG: ABC transporter ATP-binding protein [Acidobacteria bacterium]|nr:MAG: ABC transporter ATP-binding protein [Acidobacteriota bacterium]PYU42498.1 MAG: ABC transporter ATP-binding protein [Acidobacteriota bacterium]
MSEAAILTEGLSKSFGTQAAVAELNLKIQTGAVYGFLGRNGAGKTTTMRMLLGLVRPTKGSARVLGLDPGKEAELLRILERVAFVPQRKQLYGWATPVELVRMNKAYFSCWSDEAAARLAQRLEIPMKTEFKKLSIGNQSKVALLLALAQEAEVLVLDEPTAGLDPVMVDEILRTLIEDHVSQGRTIFVSSHHLGEVEQICDWVGILEEGRLLLESRLEEIRQEFRLVIASGEGLPAVSSTDVVSATTDGRFRRYVVAREAERFAAELRGQGATILEVSSLGLRELFLHLVRKEDVCTPGNAGAKPAPVSSFS